MKKLFITMSFGIALGFGVILSGCNSVNEPDEIIPNERKDIILDATTRSAADNLKDFYLQFTTDAVKYAESQADIDNVIVSPVSVAMLLSMVANGVEADIQKEITDYLGVTDLSALNNLSKILLTELPTMDNQTQFGLSNSIWVNNTYSTLTPSYSNLMVSNYLADVKYEKFNDDANLLKKFNKWCSDKTDGQIKTMPAQVSSNHIAILLNAMKFKGVWQENTFSKENTAKGTFHGSKGINEVDMMYAPRKERYYVADDKFELFHLIFGNSAFSMTVVLPNENISLSEANEIFTAQEFFKLKEEASLCNLDVYLPKFKIDTKLNLDDVLGSGRLSGLLGELSFNMFEPTQTGIIKFNQAASLDIDETGAKSAAVSSGEIIFTSPGIIHRDEYTIKVDRPFYFFIQEGTTGTCILSGRISDL